MPIFRGIATAFEALREGGLRSLSRLLWSADSDEEPDDFMKDRYPDMPDDERRLAQDFIEDANHAGKLFSEGAFEGDDLIDITPVNPGEFGDGDEGARFRYGVEVGWTIPNEGMEDFWIVEVIGPDGEDHDSLFEQAVALLQERIQTPGSAQFQGVDTDAIDITSLAVRYIRRAW